MKNLKNEIALIKSAEETPNIYDEFNPPCATTNMSSRTVDGGHTVKVETETFPRPACSTRTKTTIVIKNGKGTRPTTVTRMQYFRPNGCYEPNAWDDYATERENYPAQIDNVTVDWREGETKRHASFNILSGLLNDPKALDVDAEPYKDGASSQIADMEMVRKCMVRANQIARQTVVNDSPFAKLLQIEQK